MAFLRRVADELISVDIRHYPDFSEVEKVKVSISGYLNVDPENILLGVGSTELLDLICRAFGEGDHKVVAPVPCFPMYMQYAHLNDKKFVPIALEDDFLLSPKFPRRRQPCRAARFSMSVVRITRQGFPLGARPSTL